MKKKITPLVVVFTIFIAMFVAVNIISRSTTIKEKSYDALITITEDGNLEVSETWVYDYPSGYSEHFRDINWSKTLYGGLENQSRTYMNVSLVLGEPAVKVYNAKGAEMSITVGSSTEGDRDRFGQPIECEPQSSSCDSIYVYAKEGFSGETTFVYSYAINGAITVYDDIAELNWNLFTYLEGKLKQASVTITLPSGATSDDILCWGHRTNNGKIKIESATNVVIKAKNIKSDDALEIRLLMPTALFTSEADTVDGAARDAIVSYETKLAIKTNRTILVKRIMVVISIVILLVMAYLTYHAYIKYDKEFKPEFDMPYLRELPSDYSPAEMSYGFYMGTINDEDFTATLLDLIRRKYITMETGAESINAKDPDYTLTLTKDKGEGDLKSHENYLLEWIFGLGDGKTVTFKQIENYGKGSYEKAQRFSNSTLVFKKLCKQEGRTHKFLIEKQDRKNASSYALLPFIFGLILFSMSEVTWALILFAAGIAYTIYISSIKKRTHYGAEEYAKWSAFKRFLMDFGNMKDYPMPGVVVWEHYLVYATSLKCADKVMEQLKVRLAEENPEVLEGGTSDAFWFGYGYGRLVYINRMNRVMRVANMNVKNEFARHATSQMASGGGHGGGFSGGSSFGGGGGGGRSR